MVDFVLVYMSKVLIISASFNDENGVDSCFVLVEVS
jgi:hypothetical protein